MTPELKHALEVIRDECEKHRNCVGCPFSVVTRSVTELVNYTESRCLIMGAGRPDYWDADEMEKENANDNQNDMA